MNNRMLNAHELNTVRQFHGLNQRQLSELLGVGRSYVTMIESGHRPFTDALQARTVDALQLTPTKLKAILDAVQAYEDAQQSILN